MIKWLLAYFRLSQKAICEMSKGEVNYHDYLDDIHGEPWHLSTLRCKHCGKEFTI